MSMKAYVVALGAALIGAAALTSSAAGQTEPAAPTAAVAVGEAAFQKRCKDCHDPAVGEAPDRATLAMMKPDDIYGVIKVGQMQPMAAGLSDEELHAIAAYLTTPKPAS